MIRILVVDDHAVIRAGLGAFLSAQGGFEVVGEAASGQEAIAAYPKAKPDLVILDLRLPDMDGNVVIRTLRRMDPQVRVLVLSTFGSEIDLAGAFAAGAKGYVQKGVSQAELLGALRKVHEGKTVIPENLAGKLLESQARAPLTQREAEILSLIADGRSNDEIAAALNLSPNTVKTQMKDLFSKLEVHDRTQAIVKAFKRGLLKAPENPK